MKLVEHLLAELAAQWLGPPGPTLRIIGSTALMLRTDYDRGTKDSDVLETAQLDAATRAQLLRLAGPGTVLATRWKMHIEIVSNGLPFLPHSPVWHPVTIAGAPGTLVVEALDVVDVVVSKLKRFHSNDRTDISAMIARGLVPHAALLERFRSAVDVFAYDARAEELPRYVENLHEVERDMFAADESEIELPDWI